ncbi:3 beta-hydroxysteroid dehydrogenase/Delta 5--_4-isomerase [Colletotrichum higginsianum]|uniref:3 beta-hydroxysteroid dehydrogenase/Delta 5-->4-isomerase n=1 Tax=Colletotrichum higginsianum TaxID=80884 RepID=A0A4T0VMP0_9PEZI|nr:3 beta-hydroxysteroid dehydrogenase/Delta 5-->4-isomerase [Colletotrichum higginsianum]
MAADRKVLVLGGTGPAGICLLRELVFRKHSTIVFARSPDKVPQDLASNPLIEVIKGDVNDAAAMSAAVARSSAVLSLLGPDITRDRKIDPSFFPDIYSKSVFPAMKQHGVRRIVAMGTITIKRPDDRWTLMQTALGLLMPLLAGNLYRTMQNLARVFEHESLGLDWTVFRIAAIPGESDEASWRNDREGELYTGPVGEKGWQSSIKRSALARWIVDAVEGKADAWIGKMPAVSNV